MILSAVVLIIGVWACLCLRELARAFFYIGRSIELAAQNLENLKLLDSIAYQLGFWRNQFDALDFAEEWEQREKEGESYPLNFAAIEARKALHNLKVIIRLLRGEPPPTPKKHPFDSLKKHLSGKDFVTDGTKGNKEGI